MSAPAADPFGPMVRELAQEVDGAGAWRLLTRLNRLQALRHFEAMHAQGAAPDPAVVAWLAGAIRRLLTCGGSLDRHLGIASRRSGLHQGPHEALARHTRDHAISAIYADAPGASLTTKSAATVRIIHGGAVPTTEAARRALIELHSVGAHVGLPTSGRQIARIVHGQGPRLRDASPATTSAPSVSEAALSPTFTTKDRHEH